MFAVIIIDISNSPNSRSSVGPPLLKEFMEKLFDHTDLTKYWVTPNMESHTPLPCTSQWLEQQLREPRLQLLSAAATALQPPL